MQYKVPQNVDIEDRVIGPLTLRQFMIIAVAVGFLTVLYFIFVGPLRIIFWLIAFFVGGVSALIAFGNYGDQHFEVFALGAIKTLTNPRQRVWKKLLPQNQRVEEVKKVTEKEVPKAKKGIEEARDDFEKLAQIVDSGGNITAPAKDRIIPFGTHIVSDNVTPDLLEKTETTSAEVDPLIEQSLKSAPKREPLLSEVASVKPDQKFEYPKVETKGKKISRF